jgi:hypothetical protein
LNARTEIDLETETYMCITTIKLSTGNLVNIVFKQVGLEFQPDKDRLLYVHMQETDEEWYVYDLNAQELTKDKVQ